MEELLEKYAEDPEIAYERTWKERFGIQLAALKSNRQFCKDNMLRSLIDDRSFVDTRYGAVLIARPPHNISSMFQWVQRRLQNIFERYNLINALWISEPEKFHISLLEITSNESENHLLTLVESLKPFLHSIHGRIRNDIRLGKPRLSFDRNAIAVSWIPFNVIGSDGTVYNHLKLRGDLLEACKVAGFRPVMRYANLSAHCTIARFACNCNDIPLGLIDELSKLAFCLPNLEWTINPGDVKLLYGACWYGSGIELPSNQ